MIGQMDGETVEAVRDRRACRATGLVVRPEHEVIDDELRAASKEVGQRGAALIGLESILLVDSHPWQILALPRHFVAAPCELLLGVQQIQARRAPFLTCSDPVFGHGCLLLSARQRIVCNGDLFPGYVGSSCKKTG